MDEPGHPHPHRPWPKCPLGSQGHVLCQRVVEGDSLEVLGVSDNDGGGFGKMVHSPWYFLEQNLEYVGVLATSSVPLGLAVQGQWVLGLCVVARGW